MPGDTFDRTFATAFGLTVYVVVMAILLAGALR